MQTSPPSPHKKARIEIIPLIDIMFFLLASFMLVSMSMIKLQAIDTKVPPAQAPQKHDDNHDYTAIGIDKNGAYYFDKDKTPIPLADITGRLAPIYKEKGEDMKVFINADSDTSYATVIAVLDQVPAHGIDESDFPHQER